MGLLFLIVMLAFSKPLYLVAMANASASFLFSSPPPNISFAAIDISPNLRANVLAILSPVLMKEHHIQHA